MLQRVNISSPERKETGEYTMLSNLGNKRNGSVVGNVFFVTVTLFKNWNNVCTLPVLRDTANT